MTKPDFCRKFFFVQIWAKRLKNMEIWKYFFFKFCYFFSLKKKKSKMEILLILDFPSKIPCLENFLLWSYKTFLANQVAVFFLKCNIYKAIQGLSWFFVCKYTSGSSTNTQNNKFLISLQHLKKGRRDEVSF